jgi:hypothetical protein
MLRTICLLALALLAHVTLVATLAHACGPHCGKPVFSNQKQLQQPQIPLGNRADLGNKSDLSPVTEPTQRPATAATNQPVTKQSQEPVSDHPADLPTNDPPLAAPVSGIATKLPAKS